MKTYATAATIAVLLATPALAQTTNSPPVDANGVSVNDQTRPVTEETKDINSPYNAVQPDPRNKNKMKGVAGGAGKPSSGLAAGGGSTASQPPTKIQQK
jgi:hypothetical protein